MFSLPRLYLVTGFLGAGKTTFLKRLVHCFPSRRLSLIVNEYGREGVDGALLSGLGASLTEIDNGSIFCSCRLARFEEVLRSTLAEGPDVILVEASGLSDPSAAGRILSQREKFPGLTYAGAVCLVDAARFHSVYASSGVCRRQLAAAGLILINKTDLVSPEQAALVRAEVEARRPGCPIHETSFGMLDPAWLSALDAPAPPAAQSPSRRRLTLTVGPDCPPASLERFLSVFARDTRRIRGFVPLSDGMYLADCVGPQVRLDPWQGEALNPGRLTVLFDGDMPAPGSLWAAMTWYPECHAAVE